MNNGYQNVYPPIQKNPCLFRQNTIRPTPTYYSSSQSSPSMINANLPTPSINQRQASYFVQTPIPNMANYYYYPTSLRFSTPAPLPYSSLSVPTFSYAPTVSSKGLTIVLIATLVLVALDLVIVRPQKFRSEIKKSDY